MRLRKDEMLKLEVIKAMLELGGKDRWITTAEIQRKVFDGSEDARSAERRRLQRVLSSLEDKGYVESEGMTSGRAGKRWKIKPDLLKGIEYLTEEDRRKLLLSYIFLPVGYKDELVESIKDVLSRVSGGADVGSVLEESIGKYVEFEERYAETNMEVLLKILEALERKAKGGDVVLKFKYKDKLRIVIPIKLFSYEGIVQLTGWELNDKSAVENEYSKSYTVALIEKETLEILNLEVASRFTKVFIDVKDNERIKQVIEKLSKRRNFPIEGERPFIFSVKLKQVNEELMGKNYKISLSQLGWINNSIVVLVGFTSSRYAFRFLNIKHIDKIIEPTEELFDEYLEIAREEGYTDLPKNFEENMKKFQEFIKKFKSVINEKKQTLPTSMSG